MRIVVQFEVLLNVCSGINQLWKNLLGPISSDGQPVNIFDPRPVVLFGLVFIFSSAKVVLERFLHIP